MSSYMYSFRTVGFKMGISPLWLSSWDYPWQPSIPPSPPTGLAKAWLAGISSPGIPSITTLGRGQEQQRSGWGRTVPVFFFLSRITVKKHEETEQDALSKRLAISPGSM